MRAHPEAEAWLRPSQPLASPRLRLICFPHAGGGASFFRAWSARLPPDIELLAVRYPGREERADEPCIDQMDQLADRVTEATLSLLDRPVALFGHSLGASVAHEVAFRLESQHRITLSRLFVSGRPAPQLLPAAEVWDGSDDSLVRRLRQYGASAAAFEYPQLLELLLPVLRADFRLANDYAPNLSRAISAPVTGFVGDHDPFVPEAAVEGWSAVTDSAFDLQTFPGDHFYLVPCVSDLLAAIKDRLAA